jgi:hypothetical protein
MPRDLVVIEGESTTWTFPEADSAPAPFRSCDSGGATYHFCPRCGSTLYWDIAVAPELVGVAVGGFTDRSFPPPMIAGFEAYGASWALNVAALGMPHYQYDGTSRGGARA